MLNLREIDKNRLVDIINRNFKMPIEVWAYGSRVNGDSHDGSDLDLVVRNEGLDPLPWQTMAKFINDLKDSNIPIIVEARDWARLPESFHQQILKKHEIVYSSLALDS
jgi:predicted nucleotidyltransferase